MRITSIANLFGEYFMANKIIIFVLVSLLLTSFSLGCIFPESDNNSSEIQKNILDVSENTDSNQESVNVGSSSIMPEPLNFAQIIQMSGMVVEATIVDIEIEQVTLNDWMGMPYETQHVYSTLRVNEILKPNQDIEIGEEIIIQGGTRSKIGDHVVLIKRADWVKGYAEYVILTQEGEIYSDSNYQIGLEDLKTFTQKSDDYYEKYTLAFSNYDIVVAKMLTATDVNQMEYNRRDALPHQTHKIKIINSTSGKLTGNAELDYEIWYFPEKILKENNLTGGIDVAYTSNWIKTSDGYYYSGQWNPNSSFLKKGNYYIIYINHFGKEKMMPNDIEPIEKYNSKTKKELKKSIEEYQEIYEDVQKYETRR